MPILSLLALVAFAAQEPTIDVFKTMEVNYVTIDILATDSEGNPVTDLTKADFEVFEDKKKVTVEGFDILNFKDLAQPEAVPTDPSIPAPAEIEADTQPMDIPAQTMILLFEMSNAEIKYIRATMDQVKKFLETLEDRPNLMIFAFSMDKGVITPGFTSNAARVLEDLTKFEENYLKDLGQNLAIVKNTKLDAFERALDNCRNSVVSDSQGLSGGSRSGSTPVIVGQREMDTYTLCMQSAHDQFVHFQVARGKQIFLGLEHLIANFGKLPGMKSLYFVSPGFSLHPGRTSASIAREYQDDVIRNFRQGPNSTSQDPFGGSSTSGSSTSGGTANSPTPDRGRFRPSARSFKVESMVDDYRKVAHAAMANRIVFHTFLVPTDGGDGRRDASNRDLGVGGSRANISQHFDYFNDEVNEGLIQLATSTGGIHRYGRNLADDIGTTLESSHFYYVLAYSKPAGGGKKFREINVKCKRDGVKLSYRSGYYPNPSKIK